MIHLGDMPHVAAQLERMREAARARIERESARIVQVTADLRSFRKQCEKLSSIPEDELERRVQEVTFES